MTEPPGSNPGNHPPVVLVTGGSGFIGSALVRSLRQDGARVVVADLRPSPDSEVETVLGDLTEPGRVEAAFETLPSAIFHLAARTSVVQSVHAPDMTYRVNVDVTQRLLEVARRLGVRRFVLASTNAVVGGDGVGMIDERSPLGPLTPYGATKAAAEMLCSAYAASYGMAVAAVRLTNVYGPGMAAKDSFVVRLLRAAATGQHATPYGDGQQVRDYLFVDDAVAGLRLACEREVVGPLVIGTGRSVSVLDLCRLAADAAGRPIATRPADPPAGEMRDVRVDVSRARGLGFGPALDLDEGLARTWRGLLPSLSLSSG
jgi:UDP-glucose 4-epimerase